MAARFMLFSFKTCPGFTRGNRAAGEAVPYEITYIDASTAPLGFLAVSPHAKVRYSR